jgi:hypothetical protein
MKNLLTKKLHIEEKKVCYLINEKPDWIPKNDIARRVLNCRKAIYNILKILGGEVATFEEDTQEEKDYFKSIIFKSKKDGEPRN